MSRKLFSNINASDDGRWIAGGFVGRSVDSVALWEARSGHLLFEKPLGQRLTGVELDTATNTLVAECLSKTLQISVVLLDLKTGQRRATITPRSETYVGVAPCFTTDRRLLIQTKDQLEWWDPYTGRFLGKRIAPQSRKGFLFSMKPCGRVRIIQSMNTDPNSGYDPAESSSGLEVISERDGILQGVLLKATSNLLGYTTDPVREIVALMIAERDRCRVQVFQAPTQRLLVERAFPKTCEESALEFSRNGALLYVRLSPTRVWDWRNGSVRLTRSREVQDFGTLFLGDREVYLDGENIIRDARTDVSLIRLHS